MPNDELPKPGDPKPDDDKTPKGAGTEELGKLRSGMREDTIRLLKEFGQQLAGYIDRKIPAAPSKDEVVVDTEEATEEAQRQMLADPEGFVKKLIAGGAKPEDDPAVQTILNDKFEGLIASSRRETDERYGEGTYDKLLSEDMMTMANAMTGAQRGSERHFRAALAGLKGVDETAEKLQEARSEMQKTADKAAADAPVMLGRGRSAPQGSEVGSDEKDFLGKLEEVTGVAVDGKRYAEIRDGGNTEDDFPFVDTEIAEAAK